MFFATHDFNRGLFCLICRTGLYFASLRHNLCSMTTDFFDLKSVIKPHLFKLKPYSTARDEFSEQAEIYLDANENPFGSIGLDEKYNRYPDPHQRELKRMISELKSVPPGNIFIGNESDEAIDLLMRLCCDENTEVISCPPTYGMYDVAAKINGTQHVEVLLSKNFELDVPEIIKQINEKTRLVFICNPNNPTGNLYSQEDIKRIANALKSGFAVVDEAYMDFAAGESCLKLLSEIPNLVVLQTLSKAWGLAGLRCGLAFASEEIISWLNKIKPPYNINTHTQTKAIQALDNLEQYAKQVREIVAERDKLAAALLNLPFVSEVFPSHANFILMRVKNAEKLYKKLLEKGIIVRNRSNQPLCENCLRISVGTSLENAKLLDALRGFSAFDF